MKTLITGGAGFIGSHITDRLLSQGGQVVVGMGGATVVVVAASAGAARFVLDSAESGPQLAATRDAIYTLSFDSFGNQVKLRRIVDGEVVATESLAATGGRVIATPDRAYVLLRVRGNAVLWGTSVSDGVTPALVVLRVSDDAPDAVSASSVELNERFFPESVVTAPTATASL